MTSVILLHVHRYFYNNTRIMLKFLLLTTGNEYTVDGTRNEQNNYLSKTNWRVRRMDWKYWISNSQKLEREHLFKLFQPKINSLSTRFILWNKRVCCFSFAIDFSYPDSRGPQNRTKSQSEIIDVNSLQHITRCQRNNDSSCSFLFERLYTYVIVFETESEKGDKLILRSLYRENTALSLTDFCAAGKGEVVVSMKLFLNFCHVGREENNWFWMKIMAATISGSFVRWSRYKIFNFGCQPLSMITPASQQERKASTGEGKVREIEYPSFHKLLYTHTYTSRIKYTKFIPIQAKTTEQLGYNIYERASDTLLYSKADKFLWHLSWVKNHFSSLYRLKRSSSVTHLVALMWLLLQSIKVIATISKFIKSDYKKNENTAVKEILSSIIYVFELRFLIIHIM